MSDEGYKRYNASMRWVYYFTAGYCIAGAFDALGGWDTLGYICVVVAITFRNWHSEWEEDTRDAASR